MRYIALSALVLLCACSKQEEQSDAGETGKQIAQELQKPIEQAKQVEEKVNEQVDELKNKIEEQQANSGDEKPQ